MYILVSRRMPKKTSKVEVAATRTNVYASDEMTSLEVVSARKRETAAAAAAAA